MSRRVRNTAGTAEEAHPVGSRTGPDTSSAASWNSTFHGFSDDDRARILELSMPAGIVYAHQLPDPKLSRKTSDQGGNLFAPFLGEHASALPPNIPTTLTFIDEKLDRWQREAVEKALSTPDVFLLRGNPGSGKSRVVAEVIRQASKRGQRILFLARFPAAIDRVLGSLGFDGDSLALRCLDPGEIEQQINPSVRSLLIENRVLELTTRALQAGNRELAEATLTSQNLDAALTTLPALQETIEKSRKLGVARHELEAKHSHLDSELQALSEFPETNRQDHPLAQKLAGLKQEGARQAVEADSSISRQESTLAANRDSLASVHTELAALEPLRQAWSAGTIWTSQWWKALLGPEQRRRAAELAKQADGLDSTIEQETKELDSARLERQRMLERTVSACAEALAEERSRRESQFTAAQADLNHQNEQLTVLQTEQLDQLAKLVGFPLAHPLDIERQRLVLSERKAQTLLQLERAKQWLDVLGKQPQALRDALIEHTLLTGATAAGWEAERSKLPGASASLFDYLILEDADQFTAAECAGFAKLSRRWVLVGSDQPAGSFLALESLTNPAGRDKGALSPPSFFAEIWNRLHPSPVQLPYSWVQEGNQIVCRLRQVAPEQRNWIEAERLADHPQIVLHILALPRSQPVVAEVLFPASFTIEKAKQFILHELQELAIHASEGSLRWFDEHADRLVLQLADDSCQHHATVDLEPGVRERLHPCASGPASSSSAVAWRTCCIEFDYNAGWRRNSAEDWIERHLGLRDLGRAVQLHTLHRHSPGLALFVKSLLASLAGASSQNPTQLEDWHSEEIEFVAVPPSQEASRGERGPSPARTRSAGFELDMSDARNRDRLPADLRTGLPPTGFVNLSEAQALTRHLEDLLRGQLPHGTENSPGQIFVIALYEAQAELIRRLAKKSTLLSSQAGMFEVGVPGDFVHREAGRVLLSLTRSHTHRATPFGAGTKDLLTALTRAQHKLVVFGDLGALTRRAQWDGVLERADAFQAARERSLVTTILAHPRISIPQRLVAVGAEGQAP